MLACVWGGSLSNCCSSVAAFLIPPDRCPQGEYLTLLKNGLACVLDVLRESVSFLVNQSRGGEVKGGIGCMCGEMVDPSLFGFVIDEI